MREMDAAAEDPVYGAEFAALERAFPGEWEAIKHRLAKLEAGGASEGELKAAMLQAMRALVFSHVADVASAPAPELLAFARSSSAFESELQKENTQVCAKFAMAGLSGDEPLSAKATQLVATNGERMLEAEAAGAAHPTARGDVTRDDIELLKQTMLRHGASADQVDAFTTGKLTNATATDQCVVGVALYAAMADMPDEPAARLFSAILVRTPRPK